MNYFLGSSGEIGSALASYAEQGERAMRYTSACFSMLHRSYNGHVARIGFRRGGGGGGGGRGKHPTHNC